MKKKSLLFAFAFSLLETTFAQTQPANANFETWTSGSATPWQSSDDVLIFVGLPDPGTMEQETNAAHVYSGTSAVRLTNKNVVSPVGTQNLPGVVNYGALTLNITTLTPTAFGTPYTDRPDSIRFAAKYSSGPSGIDSGNVAITLTKWLNNQTFIVARTITNIRDNPNYTLHTQKIQYFSALAPDTILIQAISTSSRQNMVLESSMWFDSLSLIGLDTAFKAYILPYKDTTICSGNSVQFATDNIVGNSFQWYKNGQLINLATSASYTTSDSGSYSVRVISNGNTYASDSIELHIDPSPTVALTLPASTNTICTSAGTITLSGGTPAGGIYKVNGVETTQLNPATSGSGTYTVSYTNTNQYGCKATASQALVVLTCTNIEDKNTLSLRIFPNPVSNNLFIPLSGNEPCLISISDAVGRIYLQTTTTEKQMDVSSLPSGMFTISVTENQKRFVGRIIKQ